jgi:alpha-galactosidase/6-phospho-beta-glucosidase family protein
MKETKICIIGGGSRLWAIEFFRDVTGNKEIHGTINLYDIDYQAAVNNVAVAERTFALNDDKGHFSVHACGEIGEALDGCDLVIISIEPGATECRYGDLVIPEKYGVLESVGDTTGPGGIMRARRAIPLFLGFAKEIEKHCPAAWVINYTNPMTLCTAALFRGFPGIKALGCCHEVFHTQTFIAKLVASWFKVPVPDRRDIKIDITGVNHFTWVTHAIWKGIDLMPRLKAYAADDSLYSDHTAQAIQRLKEEKWFDHDYLIALTLLRDFGAMGAAGDRHLAEFLPWFLTSDRELNSYGVIRTPYSWRVRTAEEKRTKVFKDEELLAKPTDEEGVDIMMSLMGERTLDTNINRPNEGQISFLPKGRIVESNGCISANSIRPVVSSDPPLAVRNMIRQVSDVQQMTLDAVTESDDGLLFEAFISDPLVNIGRREARKMFDEMLVASAIKY